MTPTDYARLALRTSAECCVEGRCDWYHAPWSVFHALGLANTPERQRAFYRHTLVDAAAPGARILVCGAGNQSMLALVVENLGCPPQACSYTVLDLCATPLGLCARYGAEGGLAVRTEIGNVLDFEADSTDPSFDLIVTHAFLGYFDAAQRLALFRRWFALLAPGGRVVAVQRLRPGSSGEPIGFTAPQQAAFVESVMADADLARSELGLSGESLLAMARRYAERFSILPLQTLEQVVGGLERAGFVARASVLPGPGGDGSDSAPSIGGDAVFIGIEARKPRAAT